MKNIMTSILAVLLLNIMPVQARQLAIVVGIDKYPNLNGKNLDGAVNDAKLMARILRSSNVDLPEQRLLLNQDATVSQFKRAWQEVLAQAKPGDEIIVTFAGHGAQELEFSEPRDEQDKMDETLIFSEFDLNDLIHGRLSDDELYEMFESAADFSVLFVADTCHSGGLTRAAFGSSDLPTRGIPESFKPQPLAGQYKSPNSDDSKILPYVTYLAATEDESKEIPEIHAPDDKKAHGALSWSFAKAFSGDADQDQNKIVTRRELEQYIKSRVPILTDQRQHPGMQPHGNDQSIFAAENHTAPTPQYKAEPLPVKVTGGSIPTNAEVIQVADSSYRIKVEINQEIATAYNVYGDKVTDFPAANTTAWNKIAAKYRLLTALDSQYNIAEKPVEITLKEGNDVHQLNERLHFQFDPNSDKRHLVLFDLAGTGELQLLYPLQSLNDSLTVSQIPFELTLKVKPPVGEDDVVAIFCKKPPTQMIAILNEYQSKAAPNPESLLTTIGRDCQIGRYSFFTQG